MNFQLDRILRTWNTQIKLFIIVYSMIANIYLKKSMLINHISYEYLSLLFCSIVFRLTFQQFYEEKNMIKKGALDDVQEKCVFITSSFNHIV